MVFNVVLSTVHLVLFHFRVRREGLNKVGKKKGGESFWYLVIYLQTLKQSYIDI